MKHDGGPPTLPDQAAPSPSAGAARPAKRLRLLVGVIASLVILGSAIAIYLELQPPPKEEAPLAFFTIDDGRTWFTADAESLPPFDYKGHKAVKAHLYTCDGGKTRFVGWLQKLPEDVLRDALANGPLDDDAIAMKAGWMAKRPGESDWTNSKTDPEKYEQITRVKCPDGGTPQSVSASGD